MAHTQNTCKALTWKAVTSCTLVPMSTIAAAFTCLTTRSFFGRGREMRPSAPCFCFEPCGTGVDTHTHTQTLWHGTNDCDELPTGQDDGKTEEQDMR